MMLTPPTGERGGGACNRSRHKTKQQQDNDSSSNDNISGSANNKNLNKKFVHKSPEFRNSSVQEFLRFLEDSPMKAYPLVATLKKESNWTEIWNQLEMKAENDLLRTHEQYEKLMTSFQININTAKKGSRNSLELAVGELINLQRNSNSFSDMVTDPSYTGPHIRFPMTLETILAMIEHFRKMEDIIEHKFDVASADDAKTIDNFSSSLTHRVLLHKKYVVNIVEQTAELLKKLPNVVYVGFPKGSSTPIQPRITVVGDLHGQLKDLLYIFKTQGFPSEVNQYIFNGDFVDRGNYSAEIVLILYSLKLLYPDYVHLNRGNHEARDINSRDGFEKECLIKWDFEVFDIFSHSFAALPLGTIIENQIFVVHGGLARDNFTIKDLMEVDRFMEIVDHDSLLEDILWSDPRSEKGSLKNDRGAGIVFGGDVVEDWLKINKPINMIIRSHQVVEEGCQKWFDGHLYTVFSASNYCGVVDNKGAYMTFKPSTFPLPKITKYYSPSKLLLKRVTAPNVPVVIQDVICRLADLITQSNKELEDYWKDEAETGTLITKEQWARGLEQILEMEIPWLSLFEMIPGSKEAQTDEKSEELDYNIFLENYRPYNLIRKMKNTGRERSGGSIRSGSVRDRAMKVLSAMSNAIFQYRYDIEAAFRWLDTDGSGGISVDELRATLESLADVNIIDSEDLDLSDEVITALINEIDLNSDGQVDYDEFMEAFQGSVYTIVQSHFANLPISGTSVEPINLRERAQIVREAFIDCSYDMRYGVEELFNWMDNDNSGYVSMEKIRTVLSKLRDAGKIDERQVLLTEDVIQTFIDIYDCNSDGQLELDDLKECFGDTLFSLKKSTEIEPILPLTFDQIMQRSVEAKEALGSAIYHYQYDAKQAFDWIACDVPEGITKENLVIVMDFLIKHGLVDNDNLDISTPVIQRMLDDLDLNSDGQIDFEEFKEAFSPYFRIS